MSSRIVGAFDALITRMEEPPSWDELTTARVEPAGSDRTSPIPVWAIVAGPVVLVAGGLAILTATGETAGTTTSVESIPTTSIPFDGENWVRVAHDESVFGGVGDQVVNAIAAGPHGLVGVGDQVSGDTTKAVVWSSFDGAVWRRVHQGTPESRMTDVVWFSADNAYVAVGGHVSEGAVWRSSDGGEWDQIALLPFSNRGGGVEVESVIVSGRGLIAAGREWLGEGSSIPAVWASRDGAIWDRMTIDLSSVNEGFENVILDVSAHQEGLMAVGYAATSPLIHGAAIWRSNDGSVWERVDINNEDLRLFNLNGIAADGERIVIVGDSQDEGVDFRLWTSTDGGGSWGSVSVETGQTGIPDLASVTATQQGWFAVGEDGTTSRPHAIAAVWFSTDGVTWFRDDARDPSLMPTGDAVGVGMTAVTEIGGTVVVGGYEGALCLMRFSGCDLDAAFWIWKVNGD